MKIVFIAGPYSGDGTVECIESNIREAERFQIELANRQIGFFCGHNHTEHFSTKKGSTASDDFFYELDLQFLFRAADAVLAMPGWEASLGARREVEWAQNKGMVIFFPRDPHDMEEIVEWTLAQRGLGPCLD